jgi:glycosyltransferase involved in cell wall biosynthesis
MARCCHWNLGLLLFSPIDSACKMPTSEAVNERVNALGRSIASSAYILSAYSISNSFREKVTKFAGPEAQFLLLAELRNFGLLRMLRFLRSMGKTSAIYIPLEDEHSESLLPVLLAVGAVSSASKVFVVRSDASLSAVGRMRTISAILGLAMSSLLGVAALVRTYCWLTWLCHRPKATFSGNNSESIVYINANLWFGVRAGGSVGHTAGVANAFADAGYDVKLVSSNHQVMLRDSVQQHLLQPPHAFGFPFELNYFRHNYGVLKQLRRIATQRQCGFLYQRMSVMNFVGVILSRKWRVPLVLEYNGSEIWVARNWGRRLRFSKIGLGMENVCLRHADRIVVISRVLADELVEERGIDPKRIVCYPNCVDPKYYSPELVSGEMVAKLRAGYGIPGTATLVAFVGTFGHWHGASVLAAAIKKLVDQESSWLEENEVRFAMVGDGLKMKEVRELIGGSKYSRWVSFAGLVPQAETIAYLAAADILISPHVRNADGSRFFGSPTKLFEYMAMEKGIVASDLDQIGEVLSAGIRMWEPSDSPTNGKPDQATPHEDATAILTRPGEIGDLIAGIKLLVEHPDLRCRIGQNARQELLRNYTWPHHVGRILASLSLGSPQEFRDVALAESVQ